LIGSDDVTLILVFLSFLAGFFAVFLGGSLYIQSVLYETPAKKLPIRSIGCALILALFFSFWSQLNFKNPGKYTTLFDFTGYDTIEITEFDAIRKDRQGKEETVKYKLRSGGRTTMDFRDPMDKPFNRSDADHMVVAVLAKDSKEATAPSRFVAPLDDKGKYVANETRFKEDASSRYLDQGNMTQIVIPRGSLIFINLLLNALAYVLFLVALWIGLGFGLGHAIVGAFLFWGLMEVGLLPLVFSLAGK
jgi:hypothetical protein